MFLKFDPPLSNVDFISIVILSFTRPKHLKNLLQSIHKYADMPYEIIVTDDASQMMHEDIPREIFECRELTSTLVFNNGINMGYAASANKGVALANSDYILLMNDDTLMSAPALQIVKAVLDTPYVGSFGPFQGVNYKEELDSRVKVSLADQPLHLCSLPSGSSIFAFRKAVWYELGGFPQVYHNGGDIAFLHQMCMNGYFSVRNDINFEKILFRNVDVEQGYQEATFTRSRFDSSYPPIFGTSDLLHQHLAREKRIYNYSHAEYEKEFGLHNSESWRRYFADAKLLGENNYDWSRLSRFGQSKWKELVERDLVKGA